MFSLCSLPADVIRKIIRINEDQMEVMRTISPSWNAQVEERKIEKARIRATFPSIELTIIEKKSGDVRMEMRCDGKDQGHFEANGLRTSSASDTKHYLAINAAARRGFFILLLSLIHLVIIPLLPDVLAFICPVILVICYEIIANEKTAYKKLQSAMKIINAIELLILSNLSEHTLRNVRELTRNERVNKVRFVVDDFNDEEREVAIVAKKCEIVGLKPFLRDISPTVSVLHIRQLKKGFTKESSTMFGQLWGFWSCISSELLSCGMLSVTMTCGATEKKYADPVFEFMAMFHGIRN